MLFCIIYIQIDNFFRSKQQNDVLSGVSDLQQVNFYEIEYTDEQKDTGTADPFADRYSIVYMDIVYDA